MAYAEEVDSPDGGYHDSTLSSIGRALEGDLLPRRLFDGEPATAASPQQQSMIPPMGSEIDERGRERTPRPLSGGQGFDNESLVPQRRNPSDRLARTVENGMQNDALLTGMTLRPMTLHPSAESSLRVDGAIPSIPFDFVSEALGYARQLREERHVAPVQLVQQNVLVNVQAPQDDPEALARERVLVQNAAIQLQQREHALENAANQYELSGPL